jgi:hypothetical protein
MIFWLGILEKGIYILLERRVYHLGDFAGELRFVLANCSTGDFFYPYHNLLSAISR